MCLGVWSDAAGRVYEAARGERSRRRAEAKERAHALLRGL